MTTQTSVTQTSVTQSLATQTMPESTDEQIDEQHNKSSSTKNNTIKNKSPKNGEPTVEEIIATARTRSVALRLSSRGVWLLGLLSAGLLWASFAPLDWAPLAWLALVPICLLVRLPERTRWMYSALYVTSLLQWLGTWQWMRLGDTWMYLALAAWCLYGALYLPIFVALSRTAVLRLRVPAVLSVPLVWVALEFLRAHFLTGAAWYFLGHTQYAWLDLIQISDITGAYGVSFVMAMTAAGFAAVLPISLLKRLRLISEKNHAAMQSMPRRTVVRRQCFVVASCLAVLGAVLGYGMLRRSEANFQPGPRVALIQENVPTSLKGNPESADDIYKRHELLTAKSVEYQPDLIVWPETMFRYPLISIDPSLSDAELEKMSGAPQAKMVHQRAKQVSKDMVELSQKAGAALLLGVDAQEFHKDGVRRFNSAAFVTPQLGMAGRYDKVHLVLYGETVPFSDLTMRLVPSFPNPNITAGESASVFTYKKWRFAPVICFEDTVPHLVRRIVYASATVDAENRPVDCLVNMTNDGWFHGSSELDQHLVTAAFRSVECRTPMVRAVNTGISTVIDGDGAILEPDVFIDGENKGRDSLYDPATGRWRKSMPVAVVHTVPLDDRRSLYVAWGDWFAMLCGLFATVALLSGVWFHWRDRRRLKAGQKLFVQSVVGG